MHLTLIISSLNLGGAERVLSELANYLALKGHQITIVTFAAPQTQPFYSLSPKISLIQINQFQNEGFILNQSIFSYGVTLLIRLKNIIKRIFVLRKIICYIRPDLIISFVDITNLTTIIAALGLNIPVIVSERSHPLYYKIPRLYNQLRNFLYPKASYVVMQTDSAALYFKDLFKKFNHDCHSKLIIIPNAVRKPVIIKENIKGTVKHIVSVGRLCFLKGFDTLILAFYKIINDFPDLILTIYGEGPGRLDLEDLIKSLNLQNKVLLPGATQNVNQALVNADIFIFPSHVEGFPNALVEAMAVGLPVIASNCSGNIDIIKDHINGRLFPVENTEALLIIMRELINDFAQRKKLSVNARKIVEQYSEETVYAKWEDIINIL